jgi:succinylglutamate desuccinylase
LLSRYGPADREKTQHYNQTNNRFTAGESGISTTSFTPHIASCPFLFDTDLHCFLDNRFLAHFAEISKQFPVTSRYASRFLGDAGSEWVVNVLPVEEGGDLGWESVVLDVNVYLTV